MSKILIVFLVLGLCLPLATVLADGVIFKLPYGGDLPAILERAQSYIFVLAVIAAVIMITMAGIEFITSGGDPKKIILARNKIKNALIGIAVVVLAEGVILVIKDILKS